MQGTLSELYSVNLRVNWGDCDAAGIIYTPRVLDYAMEALEGWYIDYLECKWYDLNVKDMMGVPTVRMECDFIAPMVPGQEFRVVVKIDKLGTCSITYQVLGIDIKTNQTCFDVRFVACFIQRPQFKAIPIPEIYKEKVVNYFEFSQQN